MWFLPGILLSLATIPFVIDRNIAKIVVTVFKYRNTLIEFYRMNKFSSSINQTFLLMAKRQLEIPYEIDEQPWTTYKDAKYHHIKDWPYLTRIDNPMSIYVETTNEQGGESQPCVNFSSYSYLDLVRDREIHSFVLDEMAKGEYGFGNHGPRMLGGNNEWLLRLEGKIAEFFGRESAICFSSGFLACKSGIQAVASPKDIIFVDARAHESLRDGIRVAKGRGTQVRYFEHNNYKQLEDIVTRDRDRGRNAFIVIESVYSMDGDFGDLVEAKRITDKHDCKIILDEAHGLGAIGRDGRGLEELQNCRGAAWMIVGSLTKSASSVGGFITGSREMMEFMHFYGPGTMFSAPMSVPNAIAAYSALDKIIRHPEMVQETRDNMAHFVSALQYMETKFGVIVQSAPGSPLIAFIMKDFHSLRVIRIATLMRKQGFYVAAVNPPACPMREPRLRLTCPRNIPKDTIDDFVRVLDQVLRETSHIEDENMNELTSVLELVGL